MASTAIAITSSWSSTSGCVGGVLVVMLLALLLLLVVVAVQAEEQVRKEQVRSK
jgi:hypothetical protein